MLCNKCHEKKNIENFSFKNKEKKIRKKICKDCHSLYRKKHYLQNKEKYIAKAKSWNKKQKEILANYLFEVLSNSACVDCNEKDVVVLDFDHLNDKQLCLAEMYQNSYSLDAIKKEIKKCVIRCANCHRRKTAKEIGYWKLKMTKVNI
jgi:hypothetical protein